MPRVVQVIDAQAGFQATRAADALRRGLGEGFDVERIPVSGGGVAGVAAAITRLKGAAADAVVHAFGGAALVTAGMAAGKRRVVYTPADSPAAASVRWARAVLGHRDLHVFCPSAAVHRIHVERGVPAERCHLIRPGVDFSLAKGRRDPDLRRRLGFDDADRVLLLAGESTRAANHRFAAWAGAILHVLDPKYRLLIWGRGQDAAGVTAFSRHQKQPALVTVASQRLTRDVEFESLLPAADVVLATADRPVATLPVAIGMAAGLPLVGTASDVVSEVLEDRHNALLARPGSPKLLARRVLDLDEDASLQWSIADAARTEAYEHYSLTRFTRQWRELLRQVAEGRPVEVAPEAAGAGSRFHGRA